MFSLDFPLISEEFVLMLKIVSCGFRKIKNPGINVIKIDFMANYILINFLDLMPD
jgi:hypothetical protein